MDVLGDSYARSPMAPRPPAPSLTRHLLIPLSLVVCFSLIYGLKVAPLWIVAVGLPVAALYLMAPALGRSSLSRFDRDAVQFLATGRHAALQARFARSLGMRLFAPPALVSERRGMLEAESGAPRRARAAYRAALEGYPEDEAPVSVRLGMAHASYLLGDDHEAIAHYRAVLRDAGSFPNLERNLARALARLGEEPKEAERLAQKALQQAPADPQVRLVRALVHARRGQRGPARKLLAATRDADGEELDELREEIAELLEELH